MSEKIGSVTDVMRHQVVKLKEDMGIVEAANVLVREDISGAIVVNDKDKIVGVLSEFDCIRDLFANLMTGHVDGPVSKYMSKEVITVSISTSIEEAAEKMVKHNIRRLPVVDSDGKVVGVVKRRALFEYLNTLILSKGRFGRA